MKAVIVPCLLKYDIHKPLRNTFDDVYTVYQIPIKVSLCYEDENDIKELRDAIDKGVEYISDFLNGKNVDVYIIASGGVLHNCLLVEKLIEKKIPFKYLIYNREKECYTIVDSITFEEGNVEYFKM